MEERGKHPQGRERGRRGEAGMKGGVNGCDQTAQWASLCEPVRVSVCVCVRKSYLARCWGLGPLTGASTLFSSAAHRQPDSTKTLINLSIHLSLPRFLYLSAPHPLSLPTFCLTFICVCVHLIIYCQCVCLHFSCAGMQADRNSRPGPNRFH